MPRWRGSARRGAASTSWSTTPASRPAAGSTSRRSPTGSGSSTSTCSVSRAAATPSRPLLKEQRSGHIVNVASLAGLVHGPGMASYNATKAGVVALSETLSFELGPWDIDVSVICPAFFRTNLHRSFAGKDAAMQEAGMRLITQAKVDAEAHRRDRAQGHRHSARGSSSPTGSATRPTCPSASPGPLYDRMLTAQAAAARPPGRRRPRGPRAVTARRRRRTGARRGRLRRRAGRDLVARERSRRGGHRRHPRGAAVRRRRVQPHLPAAVRRWAGCRWARPHPAPPPDRHQGQGRARHAPRARHPGGAGAGLPRRAPDGGVLR